MINSYYALYYTGIKNRDDKETYHWMINMKKMQMIR